MKNCINESSRLYTILSTPRDSVKPDGTKYDFIPLGFTKDEIYDVWIKMSSKEFSQWYGKGKVDSFGQPELEKGLYIINDKGEKINIIDLKNSKDWTELEHIFKNQGDLDKLGKTLEVLNIGLIKRLSKFKPSLKYVTGKSKEQTEQKLKELSELIQELEKVENIETGIGLVKYTEYVLKVFGTLKAGMLNFDSKDVSKMTEQELKESDDKYIAWLLQSNAFLKGFEAIDRLDNFHNLAPGINEALDTLKKLQADIKVQEGEIENRIKKEIVKHLEGLTDDPEITAGIVDFLASTKDANFFQRNLRAFGDSHNPIFQSMDRLYKRTLDKAHDEVKEKTRKWKKILEKYNLSSEKDFEKFIDKERGKFIEAIRKDDYYEQYHAIQRKIAYLQQTGLAYEVTSDSEGNEIKTKTQALRDLEKEKKIFQNENGLLVTVLNKDGNKIKRYIPNSKYTNSRYTALSDSDKKALVEIKNFLQDLVKHTDIDYFEKGYIPAFNKNPVNHGSSVISDGAIISEEGNIIKFLNLNYITKLNQKDTPSLGTEYDENLFNEREKIIAENIKAHGESVNYNLGKSIELFLQSAITHKHKKTIENKVKLVNENLKHLKVIDTSGRGFAIKDIIASKGTKKTVLHEKDFKESDLYKQWKDWVEGIFYEEFTIDEGKLTDVANWLNNTTSFMGIGFNVLSAINNKVTGNLQLKMEAAGKQYFDAKEYANARWLYFKNITNFVSNMNKEESNTIVEGFIKEFDIYQDKSELTQSPEGFLDSVKAKLRMVRDKGYFMQQIGEHQIQNTALLAMVQSHRIIDGKIVSFFDYVNKHSLNAEVKKMMEDGSSDEDIKKYISENKLDKKKLKEEFSKHTSMLEAYELIDGFLTLKKEVKLEKEIISDFKEKVRAVNQKLHGAYNTEDAAMIQRHALGRMAMQFRKWMPNAWSRRFGDKFGKTLYNNRRNEYETGIYVSLFKFVKSPFVKSFKDFQKQEEKNALKAFKIILHSFKEMTVNAKIHWYSMSEQEKANVKKASMEFALMLAAYITALMLKGMGDDDDENIALAFALQQANRSYQELAGFSFEILAQGGSMAKSPFPIFRTMNNIYKLGKDVILYPFRDDEENTIKSGIYHGHSKVGIGFAKNFLRPVLQIGFLEEQNDRYGLKYN